MLRWEAADTMKKTHNKEKQIMRYHKTDIWEKFSSSFSCQQFHRMLSARLWLMEVGKKALSAPAWSIIVVGSEKDES